MTAIETYDPAHPTEVVGRFRTMDDDELEQAVVAAGHAGPAWRSRASVRALALDQWAAALEAEAAGLSELIAHEVGKPIREARQEVARTVAILRYYAQAAFDPIGETYPSVDGESMLTAERAPLGAVLAITPWNFPLAIPAWKLAPALAYGNTALLRPSSSALATAQRLVDLSRAAIPDGVLHLVMTGSDVAARLVADERIAGVSFTGSSAVGRHVAATVVGRGAPVQVEMGGQNASLVLDDANLAASARSIALASMAFAGQKCTATSRVIVTPAIADTFVPLFVEAVGALVMGDPMNDATDLGPLISRGARERVREAVDDVRQRGARLLIGGEVPDDIGWYYEPTVLAVEDPSDPIVQEETFGPVVAVQVARDDDDAVRIANGTRYGLAAAVYGADIGRARRVARALEAGMVRVNAPTTGVDFHAPFGGEKASSIGPREQGRAARDFYTRTRTTTIAPVVG